MEYKNKQFLLDKRPSGMPEDSCWKLNEEIITSIQNNEIIIEVKYLSIDPYMRGRMNDSRSYAAPAKIGEPMTGETAGVVVESNSDLFRVGDKVCAHKGWQTFIKAKDTDPALMKVPESNISLSSFLGTLGMPGRTAYFGLNRVGKPKDGETLVVSAASGAVGTVVGQLGKIYGCNVIGIAGGPEKCSYVEDVLGFDKCIDYKSGNLDEKLKNACPNGIDIYFENVGGEVTRAVAPLLNEGSRVPICGFISKYNEKDMMNVETPFHVLGKLEQKPDHRFFVVTEWMDEWESATKEILNLVSEEKILFRETITSGFENAPQALRDVLTGKNFGKQIIEI
ncbi:MAG: NADP-dependent oxidoreductase [SAR86 cluster bacterium]|uniref:NADP-dependent oxidoreductase n=1 Tax=SAR86 cluster bacterium TaxID=2030880 RepID=A0A520N5R6_9GAMM|nr:MAG: NADP-dependent oxidoreductase [SAR86 cluster bacterium]|tara:strand:+ start:1203 stop:2216 length:1014 start_codon:yes stop_codon:yes gene_type:complete